MRKSESIKIPQKSLKEILESCTSIDEKIEEELHEDISEPWPKNTKDILNFQPSPKKVISRRRTMISIFDVDIQADEESLGSSLINRKPSQQEVERLLRVCEMNEFKVTIIYKHFLLFFFYHVCLFLFLGPLTPILLVCQKGGMNLASNMALFPSKGFVYFSQILFWLGSVLSLFSVGFLEISGREKSISWYEVQGVICSNIIRCVFVAAKYGSFSKEYIEVLKLKALPFSTIKNRMLLLSWWNQPFSSVSTEFKLSLRRTNTEQNQLTIEFMRELPKERKDLVELVRKQEIEENFSEPLDYSHEALIYPADYIGKALIIRCNQDLKKKRMRLVMTILVVIRTQVPNVIRAAYGDFYFGNGALEVVTVVLMELVYFLNMTVGLTFLLSSMMDLQLRKKLMQQMSHIISPTRDHLMSQEKFFPSLNFMCPLSIRGWSNLVLVLRNYGEGFFNRSAFTLTGFITWLVLQSGYIVCSYLESFYWITDRDLILLVVNAVFETLPILITIMACIYHGALVNDHFLIHKKLMDDLKNIYIYLRINSHTLFPEKGKRGKRIQKKKRKRSEDNLGEELEDHLKSKEKNIRKTITLSKIESKETEVASSHLGTKNGSNGFNNVKENNEESKEEEESRDTGYHNVPPFQSESNFFHCRFPEAANDVSSQMIPPAIPDSSEFQSILIPNEKESHIDTSRIGLNNMRTCSKSLTQHSQRKKADSKKTKSRRIVKENFEKTTLKSKKSHFSHSKKSNLKEKRAFSSQTNFQPKNNHQKFNSDLRITYAQEYFRTKRFSPQQITNHLESLETMTSSFIHSLDLQMSIFPQKIMGFTLSYSLFWSIISIFITVGLLVFENSIN